MSPNVDAAKTQRYFYHSFPRTRKGESRDEIIRKGLAILTAIRRIGVVLAPEVVRWHSPVSIGAPSPTEVFQTRISFTELAESELSEHAKQFGPFSLEFEADNLRREGALPVIYMPQPLTSEDHLALIGAIVVSHLGHTRYTLQQLHNLSKVSNPEEALKLSAADAKNIDPNYKLQLRNVDEDGQVVQEFSVPAKTVQEFLQYIGFRNAPFDSMIGALSITQSLFYPTDNNFLNAPLAYYRQREWRITGGYHVNGKARSRNLSDSEKQVLVEIDSDFWTREETSENQSYRRVDRAQVLSQLGEKTFSDLVRRVFVPVEVLSEANDLFGDKVVAWSD